MGRIVVTGATGLVGKRLVQVLLARGDQVIAISRDAEQAGKILGPRATIVQGDPTEAGPWTTAVDGATAVVHLAGENVFGKRWNKEQKERLIHSRVRSTDALVAAIRAASTPPTVLICASAIGYYGVRRDETVTEADAPGQDFLARLCVAWEDAARRASDITRVVCLRFGIVLDDQGGALQTMIRPFKMGIGGPIGDGSQGVSWIHHQDLTSLIVKAIDDPALVGPVNATSPGTVSNRELSETLAHQLHRPCLLTVPPIALKVAFGEVGEVMAGGQRVAPAKALAAGFAFVYKDLKAALADLLPASGGGATS